MNPLLLAVDIDPAALNWIIAGVGAAIVSASGAIWVGIRKLCAFMRPYLVDAFTSHKALVDTLTAQAPVMAKTMQAMSITLDGHGALLEDHGEKLSRIVNKLEKRRSMPDDDSNDSTKPIIQGL